MNYSVKGGRACVFSGCFQILESPEIWPLLLSILGFPCGSAGKESTCNVGDLGSIPGLGRSPGEGKLPSPVFWSGEFHGLYSPWGCKESDMTEKVSLFIAYREPGRLQSMGSLRVRYD